MLMPFCPNIESKYYNFFLTFQVISKFQEVINQVTKLSFDKEFSYNLVGTSLINRCFLPLLLELSQLQPNQTLKCLL